MAAQMSPMSGSRRGSRLCIRAAAQDRLHGRERLGKSAFAAPAAHVKEAMLSARVFAASSMVNAGCDQNQTPSTASESLR